MALNDGLWRGCGDLRTPRILDEHEDTVTDSAQRWLIAIDTSTEQASIALFDGEHVSELSWPAGRDQTVSVLDQVDHLLSLNKLTIGDLTAVGIATGPGMFNGLRVGMSVAKGLAFSAGLPLIGVPTLIAVVLPYSGCGLPIIAVLKAGRGRLLWANYLLESATEPRNGTVEELLQVVNASYTPVLVCGELSPAHLQALLRSPNALIPPVSMGLRRASAVAELAWQRYLHGDFDDPVNLEPTYLHAATPARTSS
jgi:tRNA threonylcarbamoyladenosine biosynthesis protein TsaB